MEAKHTARDEFTEVQPAWADHPYLVHKTAPVWIVHYDAIEGINAECWRAYRAHGKMLSGRRPWTVDNKRVGPERGFPTLEAAIAAATGAAA